MENLSSDTGWFFFIFQLFIIGFMGVFLIQRNLLLIIVSMELILLAINLNLIWFSILLDDLTGAVFSILILTIAAAESAIGLAILVMYYRHTESVVLVNASLLHG